jgi:hypothetical protein
MSAPLPVPVTEIALPLVVPVEGPPRGLADALSARPARGSRPAIPLRLLISAATIISLLALWWAAGARVGCRRCSCRRRKPSWRG